MKNGAITKDGEDYPKGPAQITTHCVRWDMLQPNVFTNNLHVNVMYCFQLTKCTRCKHPIERNPFHRTYKYSSQCYVHNASN